MSQEFTMSADFSRPCAAVPSVVVALLPIVVAVFMAYLVIGLALPVLPLHVRQGLGFGPFMIVVITAGASTWLRRRWLRDDALRNQKLPCSFSNVHSV